VMPKPEVFLRNAEGMFSKTGELTDAATRDVVTQWLKAFAAWVERRP
jgi:hypothetical protein